MKLDCLLSCSKLKEKTKLEKAGTVGTLSHSFGPIEDLVSMPYLLVHGMLQLGLD